ncbi:hypothetical protein OHQ89_20720 [Streptomyces canus]
MRPSQQILVTAELSPPQVRPSGPSPTHFLPPRPASARLGDVRMPVV